MNSTRERLDKLQRRQRWAVALGIIGSVIFMVLVALVPYIFNAPGENREIQGTVISFETKSGSEIRTFIHVQLDDGGTVRVAISRNVFARPGSRVRIQATAMPPFGIERYTFVGFETERSILDKVLR
jgi:hypothetical protein